MRGTIATPGPSTVKYGGNTACIDVLTSNGHVIIIDAGTGIRDLGDVLQKEHPEKLEALILLSHTHWDHIQGLPFFIPLQKRRNRFKLIGQKRINNNLENIISRQFFEPYLPFAYSSLSADLNVSEVEQGDKIMLDENTSIEIAELSHPGGCIGFRIEDGNSVFAYCTDTSAIAEAKRHNIIQLAHDADLLVHDSYFYNPKDAQRYLEWGHSSWLDTAKIAAEANVKYLGLFHYAPDLNDITLEKMCMKAREIFPQTLLTRENSTVDLPVGPDFIDIYSRCSVGAE